MTPYEFKVLIHHDTSPEPYPNNDLDIYSDTMRKFVDLGAVSVSTDIDYDACREYTITDLGRAWVATALQTPPPVLAYVDSHGKIIAVLP